MRISRLLPALLVMFAAFAAVFFIACSDDEKDENPIVGSWFFKDADCKDGVIVFLENGKGAIDLQGEFIVEIEWKFEGDALTITPQGVDKVCAEDIPNCCLAPNDAPIGCTVWNDCEDNACRNNVERKMDIVKEILGVHASPIKQGTYGKILKLGSFELSSSGLSD